MQRLAIAYSSEAEWLNLRKQDLTSTDIAALFNASPYCSYFELWHRKAHNLDIEFEPSERMRWGNRLESTIALGIAEDLGLDIEPFKLYMTIPEKRLGSSFDYRIGDKGILEIKNVDRSVFKREWVQDGDEIEAPNHIEFQVQSQLFVSGREFAMIGALVGGNEVVTLNREPNQKVFDAIEHKAHEFWASIRAGVAPEPNWDIDAKFVISLLQESNPESMKDPNPRIDTLAKAYQEASQNIKFWEGLKDKAKAELLMELGKAEKCIGENYSISAKMTAPTWVEAYERKGFRGFRVTFKKEK